MAITGTHMLFYTTEAEQLRATLRDVFGFTHVDAGGGWLIFALPPSEIGVHPAEGNAGEHSISFMCDDINKTIAELKAKGVEVSGEPQNRGFGITAQLLLPGRCEVMLYQPLHPIAASIPRKAGATPNAAKPPARRAGKSQKAKRPARSAGKKKSTTARPGRSATRAGRRR
jgi:catechol 2,3-dioxygenase-like lactoylglutathione lyase family enzyme